MPKTTKPKPPTPEAKQPGLGRTERALVTALPRMLLGGMPGQVRLASREQQRPAPFVPNAKRGRRGR
jgi:hypothetical protein